ncbi:hypothetical protein [Vallicoccus soli]|uniref:Uncharacterized protein n=1 Tax=Vallicoccus soli TaxID=2339232 RepID=A0A3A3YT89_9ACTN|nr:hypothetical protein [Vallicoccus soli]RJK92979.1 hypothetical protein D5H78_17910 [Vallicoccus soli]
MTTAKDSMISLRGVSLEEVRAGGTGLYELTTTSGVPVRLHDMAFKCMTYEPTAPPSMVLRFLYDDPAWTPREAVATPVAEFRFFDVIVLSHADEAAAPDTPPVTLRHVACFECDDSNGTFALSTSTMHLLFTAAEIEVRMQPLSGS